MRRSCAHPALALIAAALLAACSDSSAPPGDPTDQLTADLAVVAADAAYEDVGTIYMYQRELGAAVGDIGRLGLFTDRACPYDATSQRFVCPTVTRDHLTLTRSYAFADATDAAQSAYDPVTTASANFKSSLTGTVSRDDWTGTIERLRDFTVSGLAGNETQHTVNGEGSNTNGRSQHTDRGTRSYEMSDVATFANVVVPFPRTRGAWPLSGTITRVITVTFESDRGTQTRERTATLTFNGTRFARLVIGDHTFVLDLATGRIGRPDAAR